ncbi:hypothetical protein, variant [Aphanomyces astaci]|uniref:Tim10-like domain-containing protein n=1 Tax=Aphanomyces astaci TaxID=112090 RepID=W4FML8_APHAT|nr:hypothetical protein, variant [Aphanomyces astaci]ETV68767.1 hypothetical protein, variant [Aphanomyces astaci]|eukprot:XP_009841721.1 hypothetical protein, variant [Aphanomyces astaci]
MNAAASLPPHQQQELMKHFEQKQLEESLMLYNRVVATCFNECVQSFRSKKLEDKEVNCMNLCAEKFLKHTQRVGVRFAEAQQAAMDGHSSVLADLNHTSYLVATSLALSLVNLVALAKINHASNDSQHPHLFNADTDATVVAAAAPATDTSDFKGANHLRKILSTLCDETWAFLMLFVIAASTQSIAGIYVIVAASMVAVDHRIRGFIAAEDGAVPRVFLALLCARMAFDMSAYNGDATPLHTLFKRIPDPISLADMVWMVIVKGVMLRLVSLSIEVFAGLLREWQSMVTKRVVRMFMRFKGIPSPPDTPAPQLTAARRVRAFVGMRRQVDPHFASSTSTNVGVTSDQLPPSLAEFLSNIPTPTSLSQSSAADALLSSHSDATLPPTASGGVHTDVLSEVQQEEEDPNASAVQALSGPTQVSSPQDGHIQQPDQGLSDLEPPTAENPPEASGLPDSAMHDTFPQVVAQLVGDAISAVPKQGRAARQPPPRLRSRVPSSQSTTGRGFWGAALNPSCWPHMSPPTTTPPNQV